MKTNKVPKFRQELFVCECQDVAHQFIVSYYEDDPDWPEIFCEIHLNLNNGFWKRLIEGIRYIFGKKSRFGAFDEIILNPKDADRYQKIVDVLKERQNKEQS